MRVDIHERQHDLATRKNERDRLQRRYTAKVAELTEAERLRDQLQRQLSKEQQDVVKLGKFSFVNKFRELTGKLDVMMEKELAEAAEAELKWNEAEKTVIDLREETKSLHDKLKSIEFDDIDAEWAEFLREKENWLRLNDSDANARLNKLADERAVLELEHRECSEAISAGRDAARQLEKALNELNSASGMSAFDTFFGGGLISTAIKYSYINSSDDYVHHAQRALRNFQTELEDVKDFRSSDLTINRRDFLTFTDYFFDNIFTDWMVHSNINDTKRQVGDVYADVLAVIRQLEEKQRIIKEDLEKLKDLENQIIIS